MAEKKSTDVMIAGKVCKVSGYEEEGYLQSVASYINAKISEITDREEYRKTSNDIKSIMIQLNIADDYFKAKAQFENAEENYKKAEKDLFELKHELVDTQMRVEELQEKLDHACRERNQKTDRERQLEKELQDLEEKHKLLSNSAKVAEEKNRQFEEMLRLSEQERRELQAVNKELRQNKEKLEEALADALLGAANQEPDEAQQAEADQTQEERKGREKKAKKTKPAKEAEKGTEKKTEKETEKVIEKEIEKETKKETEKEIEKQTQDQKQTDHEIQKSDVPDLDSASIKTSDHTDRLEEKEPPAHADDKWGAQQERKQPFKEAIEEIEEIKAKQAAGPPQAAEPFPFRGQAKEPIPAMAKLSEEELEELLAPVDPVPEMDPKLPEMPKLSEEELKELVIPTLAELSEEELSALLAPVQEADAADSQTSRKEQDISRLPKESPAQKSTSTGTDLWMYGMAKGKSALETFAKKSAAKPQTDSPKNDEATAAPPDPETAVPQEPKTESAAIIIEAETEKDTDTQAASAKDKAAVQVSENSEGIYPQQGAGTEPKASDPVQEEPAGAADHETTESQSDATPMESAAQESGISASAMEKPEPEDTQELTSTLEKIGIEEDRLAVFGSASITGSFTAEQETDDDWEDIHAQTASEAFAGAFSFDKDEEDALENITPVVTEHVKVRGSVMEEVSEEDGPELMELARQIEELERQEKLEKQELQQLEKSKKKGKKKQKRKR